MTRSWNARDHVRRVGAEVLNLAFNHRTTFRALGAVNRRHQLIANVFMMYPATEAYGRRYAYSARLKHNRWNPWPVGVIRQNGMWTLSVAVSATDSDFLNPANRSELVQLVDRVEGIRCLVGAPQKTFAGIVPGILAKRGIVHDAAEADVTARVVAQAIHRVIDEDAANAVQTVIVLGGHGFVGRRVMPLIRSDLRAISVDVAGGSVWPEAEQPGGRLIVNIANRAALDAYLEFLNPGDIVLNEVYPPPRTATRHALIEAGVRLVHGLFELDRARVPCVVTG